MCIRDSYGVAPWGSEKFYEAVFIGVIMTATSVSITVQSLKELGKLKGKVGTTIMSAAIIDEMCIRDRLCGMSDLPQRNIYDLGEKDQNDQG